MGAGEYSNRLEWYTITRTVDTESGDEVETYNYNSKLWCNVVENNSRQQSDTGTLQSGADCTIRVRNYPAVNQLDILKDPISGYVYRITGIINGTDEIVLDAYRNDVLVDYVIEDS